jgi:hypothetical protein
MEPIERLSAKHIKCEYYKGMTVGFLFGLAFGLGMGLVIRMLNE